MAVHSHVPIMQLSLEVLLKIFVQLWDEGCPTINLKSLALVCRRFHPLALSLLFNHISIRISPQAAVVFDTDVTHSPSTVLPPTEDELRSDGISPRSYSDRFLSFLLEPKHSHIRARIRQIHIYGSFVVSDTYSLLERLLCSLYLQHVWVSQIGSSPSRLHGSGFLKAIQNQNKAVKLSIGRRRGPGDGYTYTSSPHLLKEVTCLESLQVDLLNGTPSNDLATFVCMNKALKHLHLKLGADRNYELERQQTLQNIGEALRSLRSLTLEGHFTLTQQTWSTWQAGVSWTNLRSLCVLGRSLIQSLAPRLIDCCPKLRSLRLDAVREPQSLQYNLSPSQTHLTTLLAMGAVEKLALVGLTPDNLTALNLAGKNVRHMLFHIREGPGAWKIQTPDWRENVLTPSQLQDLRKSCPQLEWLAVDTLPFHIDRQHGKPLPGHCPLTPPRLPPSVAACEGLEDLTRIMIWERQQPTRDERSRSDTVFTSLAQFSSLRHLRLFVHSEPLIPWLFSLDDTMRTFIWLRKKKSGATLQSLVVYAGPYKPLSSPWVVYSMGEDRLVTTQGRETILWQVTESGGFAKIQETLRKWECIDLLWEIWEHQDREGAVVPLEWP